MCFPAVAEYHSAFEYLPGIVLPSNFATLGAIVSMKPEHEFEMLLKVLVGYGIVDALIIALCLSV